MSEILAPCKGLESITAAINAGADAVYLGEKNFSARKNADNFDYAELCEAVRLCHYSSVKVYVTLNTLVFDKEIPLLCKAVEECAKAGVDAFIVQDLGVAALCRKIAPDLPLHASTQMTVNSPLGAIAAKKFGFSRVVLGRELSKEQIQNIIDFCDIETEVFVHGALCVCVSGQCYMSAMLGGRSGNRGLCAQPCRLNFTCGDRENVLSLKDLSLIDKLCELKEMGVASFKIEGRMKRPEYVAAAVSCCRQSLDGEPYDFEMLRSAFSRSGFTSGYFDDDFHNMQGIRTKEDVTAASSQFLGVMRRLYDKPFKRYKTDISAKIKRGNDVLVTACANGETVQVTAEPPEEAVKRPISEEWVVSQLSKLGGTVYFPGKVTASVDDGLSLSAAVLNSLRRDCVEELSEKILQKNTPRYKINSFTEEKINCRTAVANKLRCEVSNASQLEKALEINEFSYIYAPASLLSEKTPDKSRIIALPPVFLSDCEEQAESRFLTLKQQGFEHIGVYTLSHIELASRLGLTLHGMFRLNAANRYALSEYKKLGLSDTVLSIELLMSDAVDLCRQSEIPCGILSYGRIPLMITRRCPINDGKPCGEAKKKSCPHSITDRKGNSFICMCNDNTAEIFNPDVLTLSDKKKDTQKFDFSLLKFTDETDIRAALNSYLDGGKPSGRVTAGLYYRGVL